VSTEKEQIVVGKIGAPYGIKGWLKITSFTQPLMNILDYDPWYLQQGQTWKPVTIEAGHQHGKGIIVKFADFDTPEKARILTGTTIAVMREQLPALTQREYYWADLEGLTVINYTGEVLGKIIYLMETGSNDVLVVKGDKELAIPYLLDEVIINIDLAKKEMHVHWDAI
jgi:16S rRNA processing protein RimM